MPGSVPLQRALWEAWSIRRGGGRAPIQTLHQDIHALLGFPQGSMAAMMLEGVEILYFPASHSYHVWNATPPPISETMQRVSIPVSWPLDPRGMWVKMFEWEGISVRNPLKCYWPGDWRAILAQAARARNGQEG